MESQFVPRTNDGAKRDSSHEDYISRLDFDVLRTELGCA